MTPERLPDLMAFVAEVLACLSGPPYNLRRWELDGEPDADLR